MLLTQAQINRLQKLTALDREGELDISGVLGSFEILKEGKVELPNISTRSGKGSLLPREDIVIPSPLPYGSLLKHTKQRVAGDQIALTSIMIGE